MPGFYFVHIITKERIPVQSSAPIRSADWTIEFEPPQATSSVKFLVNDVFQRNEGEAPYIISGNVGPKFQVWANAGVPCTITARSNSQDFKLVLTASSSVPSPAPAPAPAPTSRPLPPTTTLPPSLPSPAPTPRPLPPTTTLPPATAAPPPSVPSGQGSEVAIVGDKFYIGGKLTYAGTPIEGLLMNSRMVQGIFDDMNPGTVGRWAYPGSVWDPQRNTNEFVANMPVWLSYGLLAFTLNLQGGSPQGYSTSQPWHNSAFTKDGGLLPAYMARLKMILQRAAALGMVVILGIFYFGQDERLSNEQAVVTAVDNVMHWLDSNNFRNVLIEINNECDISYNHEILKPARVHELIQRAQKATGYRYLVSTSFSGGSVPRDEVIRQSDFILLHGNGVSNPDRIAQMVAQCRGSRAYTPKPIVFNEDDHFDFTAPKNNMASAVGASASWGYFDPGQSNYIDGFQCPPVNWSLSTPLKVSFFKKLKELAKK
jgi:hypothetical protein